MVSRFSLGILRLARAPRRPASAGTPRALSNAQREGDLVEAALLDAEAARERFHTSPAHWLLMGVLLVDAAVLYNNKRRLNLIGHTMDELEESLGKTN